MRYNARYNDGNALQIDDAQSCRDCPLFTIRNPPRPSSTTSPGLVMSLSIDNRSLEGKKIARLIQTMDWHRRSRDFQKTEARAENVLRIMTEKRLAVERIGFIFKRKYLDT